MTGLDLAAARAPRGSDNPPDCHSLPLGRSLRSLPAASSCQSWRDTAFEETIFTESNAHTPRLAKIIISKIFPFVNRLQSTSKKNPIFSPIHIFSALCKNNSSPIFSGASKTFGEMSAMRYARGELFARSF